MAATPGYSITLSGATSGAVGKLLSVSYDGPEATVIDTTTFDATNAWKTAIAGMKNARSARMRLQYDKTLHNTLTAAITTAAQTWTFTPNDCTTSDSTLAISGFLAGGPSFVGEMNGQIESEITLQFTGAPTFTAGT